MKSKHDKQYLIIGEIGNKKSFSSNKDLIHKLESSLKDLGLTKNDIILISSNKLVDASNLIQQSSNKINKENNILNYKDKYNDIFDNNLKEDFYLFSKTNRYEIYKQQFQSFYKTKIEQSSFVPSKHLFGGGIGFGGGGNDEIFLSANKININNNLQTQKIISYIKEVYTNFKSISLNINSNNSLANLLINENLGYIYKSLMILYNYYKTQIQNIIINHETLKTCFEDVNSRVLSIEKKINNFFAIKMSLNNKKEIELFELLISENKIKQIKEKINNQMNYIKEKIKNKSQKFDDMVNNNYDDIQNFGNKLKNIIDENKLNELKNKVKKVETNLNDLNKKYNRYKFEDEIKKIQENNLNINVNKSNFTFSNLSNSNVFNSQNLNDNQDLNNYKRKNDFNLLTDSIKNIKNISDEILLEIKNFIEDSIIKKFFRFSTEIFINLDAFESYNKKFKSYINLLENIDKDNFDLLFSLDEALKFRFYCNEYERRINFLKDLKKAIFKLKKALKKENEVRQKFNDELSEYFNEKLNDNKFGINSNIITFFDWEEIKGNFDIYGDKYYNNIELDEDELNLENNFSNKNWKMSFILADEDDKARDNIYFENHSQQEMIYLLNNKIIEYKSKISQLEKDINNKNVEFKELKYNFEQINDFLNNLCKNKKIKSVINSNEKKLVKNEKKIENSIKKENKIFNPLYDEINEDDSFMTNNNNMNYNSLSSNEELQKNNINKNQNNNNIENNNNYFLSIDQTYLIKKSIFNYFTNLLSIRNEEYNKLSSLYNSLQMSIEDKLSEILLLSSTYKINLLSINIGSTNIFIGNNSANIYPCFLLKGCINKSNNFICEYYLEIENFSNNIKNILSDEKNVIIIGEVKEIKKQKNKENKWNENKKNYDENSIKNDESNNYKKRYRNIVILNKIIYLISYQKDVYSNEIIFKNHII